MPVIANSDDGFMRAMDALKLMFGLAPDPEPPFMMYSQFGFHGYTINVFRSHIDYLNAINSVIVPDPPAFDANAIDRWKLMNELLLAGFTTVPPGTNRITSQLPALAALAAFPTLEEIARRVSNRWDEEGKLLRSVPLSDGVVTWKPDGTVEPKEYKAGHRIVLLSHKLQLMDLSLDPRLRRTISSLDAVLRRSMVEGIGQPMSPLYERLQFFRDQWVHGRRYEGWEALLISVLLALLYFGTLSLREVPDDSSTQTSA
jgi:hypothetical protein